MKNNFNISFDDISTSNYWIDLEQNSDNTSVPILMATPISPPYHIHVHCIQEHRIVMSSAVDGFVRVAGCEVAGVAVQKFKSSRTGLVVCLAQVEGPIVEGFFCLGELNTTT